MKKSQLKKHIKEQIFSVLNEKKSLLEKELEPTSTEEEDTEYEKNYEESTGGDISGLQKLLQDALAQAKETGDEKLVQQIANTLTYFTRAHLIKGGEDKAMMEISRLQELAGLKEYGLEHDQEQVPDEEFDHPAVSKKKKEVKEEGDLNWGGEGQPCYTFDFYMGGDMSKGEFHDLLSRVVIEGDEEAFKEIQGQIDSIETSGPMGRTKG